MSETNNLHPGLSVDCVIFGFHDNELKVLMLKMKHMDKWALPGGFVEKHVDVDTEAINVLQRRTGLKDIFLHQFYLFGDVKRNHQGHAQKLVKQWSGPYLDSDHVLPFLNTSRLFDFDFDHFQTIFRSCFGH